MDTEKNSMNKTSDFNGNHTEFANTATNKIYKDHVISNNGHIFYPCQFCNKVFPIQKARSAHIESCLAKDYILSVDNVPINKNASQESQRNNNIPLRKTHTNKIDIQQNIILNEQMDVTEILSKSKSISRNLSTDSDNSDFFRNSPVLKQNGVNDNFKLLAKRLDNKSVIITQQNSDKSSETDSEECLNSCRICKKDFSSPLDLLRHSRQCHTYPKVIMALSEIKKFYTAKDRSECPICHKPLKTSFRSAFVKHLHTHTNEMKYACSICSKKFGRVDHMKAHEKRHVINDKK